MKREGHKRCRCAIYTRVSTDQGLEQDFNSLDNQREAAEAYVRSQAGEGWVLLKAAYDDGGFSGGNLDRPALQQLLAEIRLGRIDVVVVYKVDRLTRSLADFAKLVELFDQHGVSFVSVTQAFNTTTSMGRLTLNVLLSFAQFEREVTSERIRDKVAASKRKGIWMGGMVPLGYQNRDKKLVIVEEEAERVRFIFRRYLELGSLDLLLKDLRQRGIHTAARQQTNGKVRGRTPFGRGALGYLLHNRFYIGEVSFKGSAFPGEHQPILDRELFDAVQQKLAEQRSGTKAKKLSSSALLMGKLYDDRGNRMTPSTAVKGAIRYRYYLSSAILQGRAGEAGSVQRVAAPELERLVTGALRDAEGSADADDRALVERMVDRITIESDTIVIQLLDQHDEREKTSTIQVPWKPTSQTRRREIIGPATGPDIHRPIRAERRSTLLQAIARGRRWLGQLVSGQVTSPDEIASREGCTRRQVNLTLSLAFLAPDLVTAAIEGTLPHGIAMRSMTDLPMEWSGQRSQLGIRAAAFF